MHKITLIPGDGIGPEISEACKSIIEATGVSISWDIQNAGEAEYNKSGNLIPPSLFESIEKNKIALKGPITTPIGKGFSSLNVHLRKKYDLYANIRPIKNIGSIETKFDNVDMIVFRENTEDLYAGIEKMVNPNEAQGTKVITRFNSQRIVEAAYDYADKNKIDKVTVVTKANIMKLTDGLFLNTARDLAKNYPNIKLEEILVDNMCMQMVINPSQFNVIVTENLYGDILSDLGAGLIGGLGLVAGANIGNNIAIFESAHGSATDIAGKNKANPTAMILSAAMMLEYIGELEAARVIRHATNLVLSNPENFTEDLGGSNSTTKYTKKIIDAIKNKGEIK